jgi:release factor glutamine methyltransferase
MTGPNCFKADMGRADTLVREGSRRLSAAGVAAPEAEAEWLLGHVLQLKPIEVYLHEPAVSPDAAQAYDRLVRQRESGTPLQYVLGSASFCGLTLGVAPGVFIPRPETEMIVDHAARAIAASGARRIVDPGTGSGAIALALAARLPACVVVAVELSCVALQAARQNRLRYSAGQRVSLVQGSWLTPIRGLVDAIVANPPYIPSAQVDSLPLDVRQEPRDSLDGGADGLRDVAELIADAPRVLRPGGLLVMECGEDQALRVLELAQHAGWVHQARELRDLSDRPRGVMLTRGL